MKVLVINSGSSSIKFQLLDMSNESLLMKGMIDNIGLPSCKFVFNKKEEPIIISTHEEGMKHILSLVPKHDIDVIGHRVVHGGEKYKSSVLITEDVIKTIDELSIIAPLHNPPNLAGIKACQKFLPNIPQVAVFDTSFHQTIPEEAYLYGIPYEYYKKYGIRKYGFHGTSHRYVMLEAEKILKKNKLNIISCHLGNGSSITAIKNGVSIDTSMGFTPSPGLIMGTRAGDIDPSIITFLEKKENLTAEQLENILNKKSGLLGIDGTSDMRVVHEKADLGDKQSELAMNMLAYDIACYIGSYYVLLGNVDAITFTGGIGENAYYLRDKVFSYIRSRRILLDEKKNKNNETLVSQGDSEVKVLVINANEELMIAKDAAEIVKRK